MRSRCRGPALRARERGPLPGAGRSALRLANAARLTDVPPLKLSVSRDFLKRLFQEFNFVLTLPTGINRGC